MKAQSVAEDSYAKKIIEKGTDVVPFAILILFRTGACIFAFEFAIIIQNYYCVLIKCAKGESLAALPLVCQLVVHLNRISNFQLSFLIALPASRAFIIARNIFFYTSLQSQVANY